MKKMIIRLISVLMISALFSVSVFADDSYTVTVDGGLHGDSTLVAESAILPSENGSNELTVERDTNDSMHIMHVRDGDKIIYTITTEIEEVRQDDDGNDYNYYKYYLKGVHLAGHYQKDSGDDSDLEVTIPVDQDLIYVAAYGIPNNQESYTVTYVDSAGNEIHAPDTFFANDGEKVLVAARFVDGYTVSNYKSFTGTVKKGKPISFEFIYVPTGSGSTVEIDDGTTYIYEEGEGGGGTGGGGGVTPAPVVPTPEEIIDIDEPEVPQTEPSDNTPDTNPDNGEDIIEPEPVPSASWWQQLISNPLLLGGSVAGLGLLLWLLIFLFTRKKERNE